MGLTANTDIEVAGAEIGAGLIGNLEVDIEAAAKEGMGLTENIGLDMEGIRAGGRIEIKAAEVEGKGAVGTIEAAEVEGMGAAETIEVEGYG